MQLYIFLHSPMTKLFEIYRRQNTQKRLCCWGCK